MGLDLAKAPVEQTRSLALDPTFQITKEASAAGGPANLHEKLATGEMAFAARIVQRVGGAATEALRDPETVISAARLDAEKSGTTPNADGSSTLAAKKNDAPGPQVKAAGDEQSGQAGAGSQTASDAGSNQNSDGQGETGAVEAMADLRAAAESQDGPTTAQPAQQTITGIGSPAAPSAEANVHSALPTAKSAEPGAGQLVEPPGDAANRTGESIHNISLRLSSAEQGPVQVRLSERAGELHVTVRTPDTGLTRGLRDGLPDLMSRLQVNGYRAETWQPGGQGGQNRGYDAPGHGNSQQRQGGGNQQQNGQDQQQPDEKTPQWVSEMESSIQRSNSQWPASPAR